MPSRRLSRRLIATSRYLTVAAIAPIALPGDRALELWLLPEQGNPRSLGLVSALAPAGIARVALPGKAEEALQNIPALAVSLEPKGGSPTGLPTGPVLYSGPVRRSTDPAGRRARCRRPGLLADARRGSRVMRCAPSGGVGCDDVLAGSAGATIRVVSTSADTPDHDGRGKGAGEAARPRTTAWRRRVASRSPRLLTATCIESAQRRAQTLFAHASHVRHEWRNSGCAREKRSLSGA